MVQLLKNMSEGKLLIKKMDSVTKVPLQGVEFTITTSSGEFVGANDGKTTGNGKFITDSRGYISIPGLKPGTYAVTQVSTKDGYLIDGSLHNVVIKDNGTYTLDIYNPPIGNLVIRKVDKVTKDPLQSVTFKVTTTGGALVANNGGATSTNGVYTTNASGEIRINHLQPGSYTVTEIETIPGYAKDAPAQTVDVTAGDTQTLTFEDTPLGGLLVKTMNAVTGEPLNDVTFKITTLDGTVIGTTNGEFTTDGYGNISP